MEIAEFRGKADLYTALSRFAARNPDAALADIMAALAPHPEGARLAAVNAGLLQRIMDHARGLPAVATAPAITEWLARARPAPLFLPEIGLGPSIALLTRGEWPDIPAFSDRAFDDWFAARRVPYGLGAYGEKRSVYATDQFADAASPERRTIHLGIDVFAPALTPVHAPFDAVVAEIAYNADPLDYGHTLLLEHRPGDAPPFWTLYGHLAGTLPGLLRKGQAVRAGQHIADLGDWHENGGWAAHLHFQIITDRLGTSGNFFGVGHESLWPVWQAISPDPNLILRLPPARFQV